MCPLRCCRYRNIRTSDEKIGIMPTLGLFFSEYVYKIEWLV